MRRNEAGFKIMDLMVVVTISGVIAAIAIPAYLTMRDRTQAASIKSNMHALQLGLEDFAVQNDSFYPTEASSALPDGRTLAALCSTGDYPPNPCTLRTTVVAFNAPPAPSVAGELAIQPANLSFYMIHGNGPDGRLLEFTLTSGQ